MKSISIIHFLQDSNHGGSLRGKFIFQNASPGESAVDQLTESIQIVKNNAQEYKNKYSELVSLQEKTGEIKTINEKIESFNTSIQALGGASDPRASALVALRNQAQADLNTLYSPELKSKLVQYFGTEGLPSSDELIRNLSAYSEISLLLEKDILSEEDKNALLLKIKSLSENIEKQKVNIELSKLSSAALSSMFTDLQTRSEGLSAQIAVGGMSYEKKKASLDNYSQLVVSYMKHFSSNAVQFGIRPQLIKTLGNSGVGFGADAYGSIPLTEVKGIPLKLNAQVGVFAEPSKLDGYLSADVAAEMRDNMEVSLGMMLDSDKAQNWSLRAGFKGKDLFVENLSVGGTLGFDIMAGDPYLKTNFETQVTEELYSDLVGNQTEHTRKTINQQVDVGVMSSKLQVAATIDAAYNYKDNLQFNANMGVKNGSGAVSVGATYSFGGGSGSSKKRRGKTYKGGF